MSRAMSHKLTWVLGLLALVLVTACQPAQPTATPLPTATPQSSATPLPTATPTRIPVTIGVDPNVRGLVRFMVAVPDAPAVDVYVESALVARQLLPGRVTPATGLAPDRYLARVMPAGQRDAAPLISEVFDLEVGESVIFIFTGSAQAFKLNRYAEDLRSVPTGRARVSLVNVLPQDVAVGATLDGEPTGTTQSGGLPTEPRLFKPGRQTVIAQSAGTPILREFVTLQDRNTHTLILYAGSDGQPKLVVVSSPTRRETRARAIHAAQPLDSAYDVYLDDLRIADDLAYTGTSDWQTIPARPYVLRLLPADASADARPLAELRLTLGADQSGTFVIFAQTNAQNITEPAVVFVPEDLNPLPPASARLTVVNVARQRAPIGVFTQSQPLDGFPVVEFGRSSPSVTLPAGPLQLVFTTSGEAQPRTVESVADFRMEAGQSYLYVVTGIGGAAPLIRATSIGTAAAVDLAPTPADRVTVRLINAMPNVEAVDLLSGEQVIFASVRSGQSSARRQIDGSIRALTLIHAGSRDTLAQAELLFAPNGELTIIALDDPMRPGMAQLLQAIERNRPTQTTAVLRFIHAAFGSPDVTISTPLTVSQPVNPLATGPTPTPIRRDVQYVNRLAFAGISRAVALREGAYVFEARNATNADLLADTRVQIISGRRYDVLVWPGDDTGRPTLLLVSGDE